MSNIKAFGAVAVMIACFVIIYPRFMHPFVLRALGLYEPPKKESEGNSFPPHFRSSHSGGPKPQASTDDTRKNARGPPHPGMRAAAEMQRQQSQQGSGRGMMGVVLPMYAIGIVLYLIYTLFKVFNKSKTNTWNSEMSQYDNGIETDYPVDRLGLPIDSDTAGDVRSFFTNDQQRKELEHLLTRVDDKNVSADEMRMLQKRLEETEAQMSRILKAMQSVQTNVDQMNSPEDPQQAQPKSNDTSPDMESYEVIGKEEEKAEKEDMQASDVTEDRGKKTADFPSKITDNKLDSKMQKLVPEIDLYGIDKDDEEEEDNMNDDGEDVVVKKVDEDTDGADLTSGPNIRQRKGRRDN